MIYDPVETVSTNTTTEYVTTNEFIDFKKYTNDVINNIGYVPRTEYNRESRISLHSSVLPDSGENKYLLKYIDCLENQITSLERQMGFKRRVMEEQQIHITRQQEIIDTLLKQQHQQLTNNENKLSNNNKTNNINIEPPDKDKNKNKNSINKNVVNNHHGTNNHRKEKENLQKENLQKALPQTQKNVVIVGDSLLNNIVGKGLQKDHHNKVKVRSHPGATTRDIIDHVRPVARKKPDKIILMAGSNDLTINNIDSIQNIKDILLAIRELSPETSLAVTSIPIRRDIPNSGQKVADFNNKLKTFAHQSGCDLINTEKIDGSCLGQGKLHLNTKGNKTLTSIYIDYCKNL